MVQEAIGCLSFEDKLDLYENTKGILSGIIKKFDSSNGVNPDLRIVAELALWYATCNFDPSFNVKFITYAYGYVVGALKHELRDYSRLIRIPAWYQEKNPGVEIEVLSFEDDWEMVESIPDSMDIEKDAIPLDLMMKVVPVKYHNGLHWFLRCVLDGETQTEIAKSENTTLAIVINQINKAKERLSKSRAIREWAGTCGEIEIQFEKFTPDTPIDIPKVFVDIDPEKEIKNRVIKKKLSKVEFKILALAGVGRTEQDVADKVGISVNAIRNQLNSIYSKLNCSDVYDCFAQAFER